MKLKTNAQKHEANITLDYNEIIILKNALIKWSEIPLSYLPMKTIIELLQKLETAKQTIDKREISKH